MATHQVIGLHATLTAEGRTCAVRPVRGSALGRASGVAVRVGCEASLQHAATWMPGRIAVVSGSALSAACLQPYVGVSEEPLFAAVVALVDEADDLARLGTLTWAVPIVAAGRPADRVWLERAVRLVLAVAAPDLNPGSVPEPRHRRERRPTVTFGPPGTVRR